MSHRSFTAAALAVMMGVPVFLPATAAAGADDPVVATVNGAEIYRSDVDEARSRLPAQFQSAPAEAVFEPLVNSLINTKLLASEAGKEGLREDEEVKRTLSRIEEQILERTLLSRYFKKMITEEMLKARYDKSIKERPPEEEVQASHILLKSEDKAREIIVALDGGGDFAQLARENSEGPSGASGGDLGFFTRSEMVPEFAQAAFALKKGEITKTPVKTSFGWHVIRLADRRNAEPPAFESVKERLHGELSNELGTEYIKRLLDGAVIERFNADGSPR